MIEIKEVKTRREQREFVKLPLDLYKGDPYYVPMLYSGEFAIFKPDYPFNKVCDTVFYIAYKDGRPAGRIQGIIQREANQKWDQKRVRFTRFDCIDDEEVAAALFAGAVITGCGNAAAKVSGMTSSTWGRWATPLPSRWESPWQSPKGMSLRLPEIPQLSCTWAR